MDLTHEEFVHSSSIGQDELSESEFEVTHDERHVTVSRWMRDIEAPPFWRKNMRDKFPDFEGRVDRWQIIHFEAPSTICIDVGVAKAGTGAPEGDRSQGVNGYVMNTITPETERTCHYFWAFMRNYRLESQTDHHPAARGRARRLRRGRGDARSPSSAPSTPTPTTSSTASTSTPAGCGYAASSTGCCRPRGGPPTPAIAG